MAKKKGKSVSFDAMVKFFMHSYHIPTKRDIERLSAQLERIERLLADMSPGNRPAPKKTAAEKDRTSSDAVLDLIRQYPQGLNFAEIHRQTGYGEKKLRNIIFRLNKLGAIKRKSRGIYIES